MMHEIKSAIVYKLKELYPDYKRYTDDIPQNFSYPAFVIFQIDHAYGKRLDNKYNGRISFDIAYFSDKEPEDIKSDCYEKQQTLLRGFDHFGGYKALNKNARITDNVLHMTFDVNYSEIKSEETIYMQKETTNTRL